MCFNGGSILRSRWVVALMSGFFSRKLAFSTCAFVAVFFASVLLASTEVWARKASVDGVEAGSSFPTVGLAELPPQGREVHSLIFQGGPFKYDKDGVVFGNRERMLPMVKRGYYHEYTVKTAGSRDRGARRIVCGGELKTPDVCYYTEDHYGSFRKIVP